jgi:hypothetical protein
MRTSDLLKVGFTGFIAIKTLRSQMHQLPDAAGVYAIVLPDNFQKRFLAKGSGGYFKGKEPNLPTTELELEWVNGADIIYFGKAGGSDSKATLRKRLTQYFDFGTGKPVGHYGGRLIWQLEHSEDLLVAWKTITKPEPAEVESQLIQEFKAYWGQRPFANLKD